MSRTSETIEEVINEVIYKPTPQITQRGGSTGVTIPFWLVEELENKKDDKYQAEFTDLEVGG